MPPLIPNSRDTRLVLPYDVEGVFLDVLKRRHPEHLQKVERLRGKTAGTYEEFVTMVRMSDAGAVRLAGDTVPALLLGVIGAPTWARNEEGKVDAIFQLGMQVTVMGEKRRDTIFRRDVMAWTTTECVYQRVPRGSAGLIDSVELTDYEPIADGDTQRTVGDARMVWEVGVRDVLAITGGFAADDSDHPLAHPVPGGQAEPFPGADTTVTIDRRPIVE